MDQPNNRTAYEMAVSTPARFAVARVARGNR